MCGIGGYSGAFEPELLARMNAEQAHRGPDGEGIWHDPEAGIGLAHRRLSIIDLSDAGLQPMWTADRSAGIVFNGEIYNYRELKAELSQAGYSFRTASDTEVLLALYKVHGQEMLAKLNGMFAFAIWDAEQKTLFLARDQYGVKPLYWSQTPRGFVFASELRTVLAEKSVSREFSTYALALTLAYIWTPGTITPLTHVHKLEPGCAMLVRDGRVERSWRYFSLPASPAAEPQPVEQSAEILRCLLEQAVTRQLVADVPVGAFLSGGLDSSAIVAFANRHYRREKAMECYTFGSSETDKGFVSDLPYARSAAASLGVPLHEIPVGERYFAALPELIARLDEPIADPAVLNVLQICSAARSRGTTVLLSGAGGDDLFSGYRRHLAVDFERKWAWAPRPFRALLASGARLLPSQISTLRRLKKAFENAHLSPDERLIAYYYWCDPARIQRLTGCDADVAAPLREALGELSEGTPLLEKSLYLDKRFFLVDHNLNYTDKAAMLQSTEVRVPFMDPDLVDFAAGLHPSLKTRDGEAKWIFKKAMEGILPHEIIWRPKTGFGGPLASWLRGPLRTWLKETLRTGTMRDLADPGEVAQLERELDGGADDAAWPLFVLACHAGWRDSLAQQA